MTNKLISILVGLAALFMQANVISAAQAASSNEELIVKGRLGSADGEFGYKKYADGSWVEPMAIAIDSKGGIYVADPQNDRIQKYDIGGKYLFKIKFEVKKRFAQTINDLSVDKFDNLYVLSKHEQKIIKYDQEGHLEQTFLYPGGISPIKLSVDDDGNIYLLCFMEKLIKINKDGKTVGQWGNVASFFVGTDKTLYISNQAGIWTKYDGRGQSTGPVICEQEKLKSYFPSSENGGGCHFPPIFIDKKGNRYFLNNEDKQIKTTSILIFDVTGKFSKKIRIPFSAELYPKSNLIKFGSDGNFYAEYGYIQEGFQLMRIKLQ